MALMFPRLARNFVKNGYFPTDEPTLERALAALAPAGPPPLTLAAAGQLRARPGVDLRDNADVLSRMEGADAS